jgi:hypothetical protein
MNLPHFPIYNIDQKPVINRGRNYNMLGVLLYKKRKGDSWDFKLSELVENYMLYTFYSPSVYV